MRRSRGRDVLRRRGRDGASGASGASPSSQRSASSQIGLGAQRGRDAAARCADAGRPAGARCRTACETVNAAAACPASLSTAIVAAVQLDQLLHQREPDAAAFDACGRARPRRGGSARTGAAARRPECRCRCRAPSSSADAVRAGRSSTAISPSKVNLNALESRLRTIFSHMSRST